MSIGSLDHERQRGAVDDATGASLVDCITVIRSELHLTSQQAHRLCNLDPVTCEALLTALGDSRFLRRTPAGVRARADYGSKGAER